MSQNMNLGAGSPPTAGSLFDIPFEIRQFEEGDVIFNEGDVPTGIYFMKSGAAKLVCSRPPLRGRANGDDFISQVIGPNDFFGQRAMTNPGPHNCTARCLRPSEVQIFALGPLRQLMNGPPNFWKSFLQYLADDFSNREQRDQNLYLASVQERIAKTLLDLAKRFGVQTPAGLNLNLRLSRNEYAQLAGTINESLSRHLTELRDEGVLALNGKEILIRDIAAMTAKAGGVQA